ncbi:MAG: hypothetical protein LC729_03460 [Acidobacteria bacterium]|nr:hypothetical protein [Acidobacteriota bacterium]
MTTPARPPLLRRRTVSAGFTSPCLLCHGRGVSRRNAVPSVGVTIPWRAHRLAPGRAHDPEGSTFVEILKILATYHALACLA